MQKPALASAGGLALAESAGTEFLTRLRASSVVSHVPLVIQSHRAFSANRSSSVRIIPYIFRQGLLPQTGSQTLDRMRDSNVSSWSGPATPSLIACIATALVTANETERSSVTGVAAAGGEISERHLAAAMNMASETRCAFTARTPNPIPGKM